MQQAIALHQQGRLAEAEILYRQALALAPHAAQPHYQLGVLCMQAGRFGEAVAFLQSALGLKDGDLATLVNLGMALRHLGRPADSLAPLDRAIALKPDLAETHYQRGAALHELGRLEDADVAVARALNLAPDHPGALFLRALVLSDLGRVQDARLAYDRLLQRKPDHLNGLNNRGLLAWGAGEAAAALADFHKAVALNPTHTPSLTNRALVLGSTGRVAEALVDYETLLALVPDDAEIWNRHGATMRALGRDREALQSFDRALGINPDHVIALANRGYLRWVVESRYDDAKADLSRALALDPAQPWLEGELVYLKMQGADWDGFATSRAALAAGIAAGRPVIKPFAYQAISDDPASLQTCARTLVAAEFPALPPPPSLAPGPATAPPTFGASRAGEAARRRIRIGYVSADFREQATAYLMAGVYEARNRQDFEITAFDNGFDDQSPMRARLEQAFDRFVPIAALDDDAATAAVRAANIDILVNLNGWFGKPRMNIFAHRAAPIQVNYLGFPGTLGAPYMDYIIADRIVIPEGEQRFYDEAVVLMPDSYQANDAARARPTATSRAAHGLPEDAFVFCNFNQSYKLGPQTFNLWLRLLRACPNSVLWLLRDHDIVLPRLRAYAQKQGVGAERLVFSPLIPLDQHLSRVALADLFLDSLPYNAHTTGSDALWAGVPMITCRGTAFPGRVAASLLTAAGLPELITETPEDYEALACALAAEPDRLAALRAKLAANRESCALFDTARFTRHLETAYRTMMTQHQNGAAPQGFAVPD